MAVSIETTFRRVANGSMLIARQASVEGLAHRFAVRRPGLRQYVDTTIGGYSPSLTTPTIAPFRWARQRAA
jgi:hypothetical protein